MVQSTVSQLVSRRDSLLPPSSWDVLCSLTTHSLLLLTRRPRSKSPLIKLFDQCSNQSLTDGTLPLFHHRHTSRQQLLLLQVGLTTRIIINNKLIILK
ncbi:hypothetical protein SAMD00019534_013660, partial [Acytostelium subglobosum LB1]|uniref:hypothetical protein n=1 Tax=Acytostelium subglobosum LB1 TaxID=1410327 RepID=UPI000644BB55